MSPSLFQRRLAVFLIAAAVSLTLLLAAANHTWHRITDLQQRFSFAQLDSFRMADTLQHRVMRLNNLMLRFRLRSEPESWSAYLREGESLQHALEQQAATLTSQTERPVLGELITALADYRASAVVLHERIGGDQGDALPAAELLGFEAKGDILMQLGLRLGEAHRAAQQHYLADANVRLGQLRNILLSILGLLLLCGCWLGWSVYRDLISPLRLQLVESRALAGRQEKLASLGMLAAGVAHEIRNPLTAIRARLYTLKKQLAPGSVELRDGDIIDREIDRLERIVREFLLFARPSEPKLEKVRTGDLLEEVCLLFADTLEKRGIEIRREGRLDLEVNVDPAQIKQVLINLTQNAAEAIAGDGKIILGSFAGRRPLAAHDREVVILEVADDGAGIPAEVQKRLFDPFYTTKSTGTGLGLSIASRIVERHGGALQYQTQPGRGTRFGIVLPLATEPETIAPPPAH